MATLIIEKMFEVILNVPVDFKQSIYKILYQYIKVVNNGRVGEVVISSNVTSMENAVNKISMPILTPSVITIIYLLCFYWLAHKYYESFRW